MKNKNIIYFYRDWIYLTEELTVMQKGYVWDWFVKYINDLEPNFPNDETSKGVCIVLKGILKRDLAKWNAEYERRSEAGKKGMEKRWQQSEEITNDNKNNSVINVKQKITKHNKNNNVNDIDIVKDKDIVKVKDIDIVKDTYINVCEEENQIELLQELFMKIETLLKHTLSMSDIATIRDFKDKGYSNEIILNEIKNNIDKNNPIAYIRKSLENATIQKKVYKVDDNVNSNNQPSYEITDWMSAFKIANDESAPEYARKKAKEYMEGRK